MTSQTQLVATIGPACETKETIIEMVNHKMDMARLNFSWGTHETHAKYIQMIREASEVTGTDVLIIQDLSGPRVSTEGGHHVDGAHKGSVITEKDIADLEFGLKQGVDFVALSYVGAASDIIKLKELIRERADLLNGKPAPFVIAKIERKEAIDNLQKIIDATDWVMVARGDLGNEFPLEEIPFVQHKIIKEANKAKKPVIVATQMLLSMVENPTPTRAEVSDIAYAIIDGAQGTMLSDETAKGKYPVQSVAMMEKIISYAEAHRKLAK